MPSSTGARIPHERQGHFPACRLLSSTDGRGIANCLRSKKSGQLGSWFTRAATTELACHDPFKKETHETCQQIDPTWLPRSCPYRKRAQGPKSWTRFAPSARAQWVREWLPLAFGSEARRAGSMPEPPPASAKPSASPNRGRRGPRSSSRTSGGLFAKQDEPKAHMERGVYIYIYICGPSNRLTRNCFRAGPSRPSGNGAHQLHRC